MQSQNIDGYKHSFLADNGWVSRSSKNYVFKYLSGSEAERDMDFIVSVQEAAYEHIISFLGLPDPARKIVYYFYQNIKSKKELMGNGWYAHAVYNEFCVHALYTKKVKPIGAHEDTHLLSLPLGLSIGFFQEGLAEFMSGRAWDGNSHLYYVRRGYSMGLFPVIGDLMEHDAWLRTDDRQAIYYYSLAGEFVRYLITIYGLPKFKSLYSLITRSMSGGDNSNVFLRLTGTSISKCGDDFIKSVRKEL